ncbi:hypothetical protein [Streptomyces zaomyceticus]|uniref:hypothetical protein n=1 Tax=Streptomyces zaomyceticus TaxID=68286 RepID=UPI0036B7B5A9
MNAAGAEAVFKIKNKASGNCVVAGKATVTYKPVMAGCSTAHDTWTFKVDHGVPLLMNTDLGLCLDGNSSGDVYFSTCSGNDLGQWWYGLCAPDLGYLQNPGANGKQLTGWGGGSVSLRAPGDVDDPRKQRWDLGGARPTGCVGA